MTTQFLRDHQISAKTIDMIEDARTSLMIVSPWLQLKDGTHLAEALQKSIKRGVNIAIFCRRPKKESTHAETLEKLGDGVAELFYDTKLHAKMILSDSKSLLVTSANLIEASQTKNHETGLFTNDEGLVEEALKYLDNLKQAPGVKRVKGQQLCRECSKEIPLDPSKPWCLDCWETLPKDVRKPYIERWKSMRNSSDEKNSARYRY